MPQPPQCSRSLRASTQESPQIVPSQLPPQTPPTQASPSGQASPQPPQCRRSLSGSTQPPSQRMVSPPQLGAQLPSEHGPALVAGLHCPPRRDRAHPHEPLGGG